jgi:hypothetical protein
VGFVCELIQGLQGSWAQRVSELGFPTLWMEVADAEEAAAAVAQLTWAPVVPLEAGRRHVT